jgi:hypothetical protein
MNTLASVNIKSSSIPLVLLGLAAALVVWSGLSGVKLPLVSSPRSALIVLTVIGMAMCGLGMKIGQYGWLHPTTLLGILLGIFMLGMVIAVLAGVRLPLIGSERQALLALAGFGMLKVLLDLVRGLL